MDDFVNYLEKVNKHLDNINVKRILRKYIRNLEDPLEKYNDDH